MLDKKITTEACEENVASRIGMRTPTSIKRF